MPIVVLCERNTLDARIFNWWKIRLIPSLVLLLMIDFVQFELFSNQFVCTYRNPSHPDLKCWKESRRTNSLTSTSTTVESSVVPAVEENKTVGDTLPTKKGECVEVMKSEGHAVVNGHADLGNAAQNGLLRVKQERPSTPPPSLDGPGDSNNNIQGRKAPVSTNTLSTVADTSSRTHSSLLTSTDSGVELSEGSTVKKEEEPLSPIPALVPVGGPTPCVKSQLEQMKPETVLNLTPDNSQSSVKSEGQREGAEKSTELKSSVASTGTVSMESNPQPGSETQIKQENELRISSQSKIPAESNITEDTQGESVQRLSDDDGIGAMDNLLGDINQIHDDLEERMDQIEQQLAGGTRCGINQLNGLLLVHITHLNQAL